MFPGGVQEGAAQGGGPGRQHRRAAWQAGHSRQPWHDALSHHAAAARRRPVAGGATAAHHTFATRCAAAAAGSFYRYSCHPEEETV